MKSRKDDFHKSEKPHFINTSHFHDKLDSVDPCLSPLT